MAAAVSLTLELDNSIATQGTEKDGKKRGGKGEGREGEGGRSGERGGEVKLVAYKSVSEGIVST